ncbi:hypothetical protein MPSEU_001077600 [Mayamaea pseudoterrestris]|nr:hypothetical protein MPSEU_001077600 [Mayamaea pseudoterrestris]
MDKRNRQKRRTAGALISTLLPGGNVAASPTAKRAAAMANASNSSANGAAAVDSQRQEQQQQLGDFNGSSSYNNNEQYYHAPDSPSHNNNHHHNNTPASPSKPSSAQPRPTLKIPPRGIGPITDPHENDVLCGRGGRINSHEGNVRFRTLVHSRKKTYLAKETRKLQKAHIAANIVQTIRSLEPAGRFLKEDSSGMWYDIGDAKAIKKVGQALREDAPDFREDGEDDDDSAAQPPSKALKKSPLLAAQQQQYLNEFSMVPGGAVDAAAAVGAFGFGAAQSASFQPNVALPRFSGAAAAAIRENATEQELLYAQQQQHAFLQNEAFGRQFHPASVFAGGNNVLVGSNHDGSSLISGLSNPTLLSGMSLSSGGVSDQQLASLARAQQQQSAQLMQQQQQQQAAFDALNPMVRANQLQHLRNQWAATQMQMQPQQQQQQQQQQLMAAQQAAAAAPSDYSRFMLVRAGLVSNSGSNLGGSSGLGSSAATSGPGAGIPGGSGERAQRSDSMSWTGNGSGHTLNEQLLAAAAADGREDDAYMERDRLYRNGRGGLPGASTESVLSNGDDTYPSMAESIMSDLSENLIALDLAEPKLLDQI